ncbi:hypothetical protein [Parabacteroides sp.]|uniref:hypothetical protein n=1 Tax=Parabacteroides sp. TaxID=1869337 RepID=UPI00257950AC|nr:hypothetical protein [Parabacteroides sp.]
MRKVLCLLVFAVLVGQFFPLTAQLLHEKIYLHVDTQPVNPGDTLVVTGLVTEAAMFDRPQSRYAYVELLDRRDSVLFRQKLAVGEGLFRTRIPIEPYFLPDIYYLRAYTHLMQNSPVWSFPICPVGVGQNIEEEVDTSPGDIHTVRFFPEGGHLVGNCLQQVVFEVKDCYGDPLIVSGSLINHSDSTIVSHVSSFVDGRGLLRFIPRLDDSYTLRLQHPNGNGISDYPLPFPGTQPSLQMRINRDRLVYTLTTATPSDESYPFALFFRGNLLFEDTLTYQRPSGMLRLSGKASGIYTGVLLHDADSIYAERSLLAWYPEETYVVMPDTVCHPGTIFRLPIQASDSTTRYWIRIESEGTVHPSASFLPAYLHLFSEGSYPIRPSFFNSDGRFDLAVADRLLQTCRWERYSLMAAMRDSIVFRYLPEKLLVLSGRVENRWGEPLKKGGSLVALDNESGFTYTGGIDSHSRFLFGVDDFPDGRTFFLQAYDHKGESFDLKIVLDSLSYPPIWNRQKRLYQKRMKGTNDRTVHVEGEVSSYYDADNQKHYFLPDIEVAANVRKEKPQLTCFYQPSMIEEEQIDQIPYSDILPLFDRLVGVQIKKVSLDPLDNSDDPLHFRYGIFTTRGASSVGNNTGSHSLREGELAVLLDGTLVEIQHVIDSYSPQQISSIERLTPSQALVYTPWGFNGAILIRTRGWEKPEVKTKGMLYQPEGLSPWATTLPAQPDSICLPTKEGYYRIIVEGIDRGGNPFCKVYPIQLIPE